MGQILHGSARTTAAVRRAIQHSHESLIALSKRHGITVACETLRQLTIQALLWKDRDARRPRPYQPRYRWDCRGKLIQVDGSKHWWFEDRGPQCTLLVYIDDATSELMQLFTRASPRTQLAPFILEVIGLLFPSINRLGVRPAT